MGMTDFKTVDEFIATFDGEYAKSLKAIRKAIRTQCLMPRNGSAIRFPRFTITGGSSKSRCTKTTSICHARRRAPRLNSSKLSCSISG